MPLCPKCRKRLAKRSCPALGVSICQLCCGSLREKDIRCVPSCPHLSAHKPYQERRTLSRQPAGGASGKDLLEDERMAWLAFHIETALAEFDASHEGFSDRDASLALEYAREKSANPPARLILPGAPVRPVNEAGETLLQRTEACRFQRTALITSGDEAYKHEEIAACLERVALAVNVVAGGHLEGRRYLDDLQARVRRAAGDRKKLITLA
jgi:hypothetical protein